MKKLPILPLSLLTLNDIQMKYYLTIIYAIFVSAYSFGQSPKDYKQGRSFAFQTDAFDLMAKGFSLGANTTFNYNRIFVAAGKNELPDFLNPNSEVFYEKRKFFVQAGYLRFLKKTNGLFLGVETIYQKMEVSVKLTSDKKDNSVVRIAPVIGYEWTPFKNSFPQVTITPWISERIPLYSKEVQFIDKSYKTADFNFVMGLNLAYRFK